MQELQIENTTKATCTTQVDPVLLSTLKYIAADEGRHIQALIDEALSEYIERKIGNIPRRHIIESFKKSMSTYDSLYRDLAK